MAKPFVIQNPYKNTPATGNRLISVSELEDAVKGVFKSPCRAVSVTDIAGTYSTENMTLTVTEPGENWAVDSITMEVGDRVLLVGQTEATQNGVYDVTTLEGSVVLTRANDFDSSSKIYDGAKVWVGQGGVYSDTSWTVTTNSPFELDTTDITFKLDSSDSSPAVISKTGTLTATGTTGEYTFTHNLNDPFPIVQLYNLQTSAVELADVELTSNNVVTIRFAVAPADTDTYKVIVHGQPQA